jgi:sulfatase maturation enzyme AslB (radical SAM superfamily)
MEQILQDYESRKFMIFNISELDTIDFTQVCETSQDTIRKSVDGSKTFVKWDGDIPECVSNLNTKEGPYTYDEILEIMNTPEWTYSNVLAKI